MLRNERRTFVSSLTLPSTAQYVNVRFETTARYFATVVQYVDVHCEMAAVHIDEHLETDVNTYCASNENNP